MSASDPSPELSDTLITLESLLESPTSVPDKALQRLLAVAVSLYAAKAVHGNVIDAFVNPEVVTATDVAITVTNMLAAVEVEVFELAVWQNWGIPGRRTS
jgi:hypothetical protein